MKTAELTGNALDWAVAKCEGMLWMYEDLTKPCYGTEYSTNWVLGGHIIDREKISLESPRGTYWTAAMWTEETNPLTGHHHYGAGDTALIAAMRCYVASKLGDEVEIPEELMPQI